MPKFVKKPIPIEARQFWQLGDHPEVVECAESPTGFAIRTLENTKTGQHVTRGDWIITGVQGEHYPCNPDVFEATYDPA